VLERNTKTLTRLIEDIIDISKVNAGKLTLDFEEVDLKQIVSSSIETLRVQAAQKGIALKSEIQDGIDYRIRGDEVRLQQILANVLNNALKFTQNGGTVVVHLRKARATAILRVEDTGTGISAEFLPHVFEHFTQAESNLTKNQGMGLGLAICKHLVELQHPGSISAESEGLGCGTTIKIELRLMTSESAPSFEPAGDKTSTGENTMFDTRLRNVKVLAVDDDADTRNLVKAILERSGAQITVAGSGREVFEVIKNTHPDVLICDLAMPEMDGYELLQKVRHLEPKLDFCLQLP
jgi:CheY-like chemotaxis protein